MRHSAQGLSPRSPYSCGLPSLFWADIFSRSKTASRADLHMRRLVIIVAALFVAGYVAAQRAPDRFDVLIRNGRIVDGTGAPWFRGDVGISGDRIAAVGSLAGAPAAVTAVTAAVTIDATDLVVSPGFIDLLGQSEFNVLVDGRAASKIMQGVTTEVTG